jgi:hypothetical protein
MRRKGDLNKKTIARDFMIHRAIEKSRGTLVAKKLATNESDEVPVFDFFAEIARNLRIDPEAIRTGMIYRIARLRREYELNWRELAEGEFRVLTLHRRNAAPEKIQTPNSAEIPPSALQPTRGRPRIYTGPDRPKVVALQIDRRLLETIDLFAKREERTRAKMMRILLRKGLETHSAA